MRRAVQTCALAVIALALVACASGSLPADRSQTAEIGNAALGLAYAQANCAACHAVTQGQSVSPNPQAPAFGAVANTPGMTRTALAVWLHSPHANMPDLIVDPAHIDDLSAYLATLDKGD